MSSLLCFALASRIKIHKSISEADWLNTIPEIEKMAAAVIMTLFFIF
jgi:hypothetical protein